MGIAMMGSSGGDVLGPILGGLLSDWGGFQLPFVCLGALLLLNAGLQLALVVDKPRPADEASDLAAVLRDRAVLAAALAVVLCAGGWAVVEPLLPHHLFRIADATATTTGLLFTGSTLIYGLSAPLIGAVADRFGLWPTIFLGLVLMALSLPLLALAPALVWVGVALALVNVSFGFALNPALCELGDTVDRRGTGAYAGVYAVYNIAYSVAMLGSNFLGGALASSLSFLGALTVISVVILVFLPLIYFVRPRHAAPVAAPGDLPGS
jgi:predicted MFS family arabinose efflux permease